MSTWMILRTISGHNIKSVSRVAVRMHPNGCALLCGISAHRHDSVFHAQKPLQGSGQAKTQFLPGQHFASSAKTGKSYATYNAVPVLEQVRPAPVKQRAKIET